MRKICIFIAIILLQLPLSVYASDDSSLDYKTISTNTKYYKTINALTDYSINRSSSLNNFLPSITVEISEEEYNSENGISVYIDSSYETTYKKITISILENGSTYKYIATLEWKNMPATRSYDIIAIGFNNSVKASSVLYETYYCINNGGCTINRNSSLVYDTSGVGAVFQLPTSSSLNTLKSTLSLVISKNINATITEQKATADYSHATKSISLNNAQKFNISSSKGIVLDNSINSYYDEIASVTTKINCNW